MKKPVRMDFILGGPATLEMVELKYVLEAKIPSINVRQLFHSSHSTTTPADFVDHLWHGPLGCLATILIKSGITLWLGPAAHLYHTVIIGIWVSI